MTTVYVVEPIDSDPEVGSPAVRLIKDDGRVYEVIRRPWGFECDCEDGVYRRQNTPATCKHVRALQAVKLLPPGR